MGCPECGDHNAWTMCYTCDWTEAATTDVSPEAREKGGDPNDRNRTKGSEKTKRPDVSEGESAETISKAGDVRSSAGSPTLKDCSPDLLIKITLPLPPNMANASWAHWGPKHKDRVSYEDVCDIAMLDVAGVFLTIKIPKARIRATLYMWNRMDEDNLTARLKWPVDWLVKRGVLVDDSPKHLEWEMPQQFVDRKNPRVEIELEAV